MRKALNSPHDLQRMPSLLGRIFRIALYGADDYDYSSYASNSVDAKNKVWQTCRDHLGMHSTPDRQEQQLQYSGSAASSRQQYTTLST